MNEINKNTDPVQVRWNRYVKAINFCIRYGFIIDCIDRIDPKTNKWNGNVKAIKVKHIYDPDENGVIIQLQPRKYKSYELLDMIYKKFAHIKINLPKDDKE